MSLPDIMSSNHSRRTRWRQLPSSCSMSTMRYALWSNGATWKIGLLSISSSQPKGWKIIMLSRRQRQSMRSMTFSGACSKRSRQTVTAMHPMLLDWPSRPEVYRISMRQSARHCLSTSFSGSKVTTVRAKIYHPDSPISSIEFGRSTPRPHTTAA